MDSVPRWRYGATALRRCGRSVQCGVKHGGSSNVLMGLRARYYFRARNWTVRGCYLNASVCRRFLCFCFFVAVGQRNEVPPRTGANSTKQENPRLNSLRLKQNRPTLNSHKHRQNCPTLNSHKHRQNRPTSNPLTPRQNHPPTPKRQRRIGLMYHSKAAADCDNTRPGSAAPHHRHSMH